MITAQPLLLLILLSTTTAIREATGKNETVNKKPTTVNTDVSVLSSETKPSSSSSSSSSSTSKNIKTQLSDTLVWGHNTKYSTVIFDENITVKESTFLLDIKYPPNDDYNNEFVIIGIHIFAIGKLHFNDISVHITAGGVGTNFTTIRFESNAHDGDVEFNVKIFGVSL